ncbi:MULTISPECIES: hypothetical protein [Rhodomicrobium]|uniref:hypothetical protein n=1 Tax=Rhodomicrobium TaxID=1068 RepID=UPI000B4A6CD8|nr:MULTISPECIES: hypothetical protein [Rhodomicrobium]
MNRDEAPPYVDHSTGPVRTETQTKQAGAPRATVWILGASILLALIIGGMLLSNTDEVPPSTQRSTTEQSAPAQAPEGVQPVTPAQPASPPTNQ